MPKSIAVLCAVLLLSACGQTGALYLPDRDQPVKKHKDTPAEVVPPSDAQPDDAAARDDETAPARNPDDVSPAATSPSP